MSKNIVVNDLAAEGDADVGGDVTVGGSVDATDNVVAGARVDAPGCSTGFQWDIAYGDTSGTSNLVHVEALANPINQDIIIKGFLFEVTTTWDGPSLVSQTYKAGFKDQPGTADDDDAFIVAMTGDGLTAGYYGNMVADKGVALDLSAEQEFILDANASLTLTISNVGCLHSNLTKGETQVYVLYQRMPVPLV